MQGKSLHIAVIGAGFSGALLAVHLLQRCRPGDRIYLIETRASFGRGLAYSTTNLGHLLNVRAANMSAFHEAPDHFVEWLRHRAVRIGGNIANGDCFVSRRLYGNYIRSLLCDQLWAGGKGRNLFLVPDQAISISEDQNGASVRVAGGRHFSVDVVVVAAGNSYRTGSAGQVYYDPWDPRATQGVDSSAPVLLIGTGLTMVDVFQSLTDNGHRGPIHAFSRRGLLPQEHAPTRPRTFSVGDLPRTTSVARIARWLRKTVEETTADGDDWRGVFDGLRPHVPELWRRLPIEERRRFVRHLQPWWGSHRHRLAPQIAHKIAAAIAQGRLDVGAARVLDILPGPSSAHVRVRRRGSGSIEELQVARVIDCTGPDAEGRFTRDPLMQDLMDRGLARPDPLGLGLDVSEQGALLNCDGIPSPRLFAVGPVTRGTFWEIVAVPDIRLHCVRLSNHLMGHSRERLETTHQSNAPAVSAMPDTAAPRSTPPAVRMRPMRSGPDRSPRCRDVGN